MKFTSKINKKEKGIIEINVSMPFSEVSLKKEATIEQMVKNAEIEGFRKGKAPKSVVVEKVGENKILQESSQAVINEVFPQILEKEKLQIIGYPSISVVQLKEGEDFKFNIQVSVYPEISLPDYKKIAKEAKKENKKVDDKEIEKVEKNLVEMQNSMHSQTCPEGEKCKEKCKKVEKLTDDFVKQLGPFKNVDEFKEKVKQDLEQEAKARAVADHRSSIAEKIIAEMKIEVPEILITAEIDKIIAYLKDDLMRQGLNWNDYLKKQNKNEVELRESFHKEAEKRAKIEVILKEIFKKEGLKINKEESKKQEEAVLNAHPDADPENVRLYIENIMINEAVMQFLEKLSEKK